MAKKKEPPSPPTPIAGEPGAPKRPRKVFKKQEKIIVPVTPWLLEEEQLAPFVTTLSHDITVAARDLGPMEARYLVDLYYTFQDYRKSVAMQWSAGRKSALPEPMDIAASSFMVFSQMEQLVKRALLVYSERSVEGQWLLSNHGVGPCIAAGCLAHIDLRKCPTASGLWKFAGMDKNAVWKTGQRRPWNARLKQVCWRFYTTQWKFNGNKNNYYGQLMRERWLYETAKNEALDYKQQAEETLALGYDHSDDARAFYEEGKLPPIRIWTRAGRWTVKLFLSHYYQVGREILGLEVIPPYILGPGGHTNKIEPPNWPLPQTKKKAG